MKETLFIALKEACKKMEWPEVSFTVEHPADITNGDYSSNVALVLARGVGLAPRLIAERLSAALAGTLKYVDRIEIAGPGFLNFYLTRDFFTKEIAGVAAAGDSWGRNTSWSGKRILVEYTDPNPFKEFHVGHLFTNAVGESLARLAMMQGADVLRVNYQGDVGLHVACAVWGMQQLGISEDGDFGARELGRAYALGATAYKNDTTAQVDIRAINRAIYERSEEKINALYDRGRSVSLAYFEDIYRILDTTFDAYFFESETGLRGREIVQKHPEIFLESAGARVFVGEKYGLHTRVFINKEGLPTYEAKELALAKIKEERIGAYDLSIVCAANEVAEYFKVLKKALSFIYPELSEKTEHVGHGLVRLTTGKMSSRTGDVISALDFISEITEAAFYKMEESGYTKPTKELAEEVAVGAIKYATLRGSIYQNSIFDKEQALSFEGDSGPYLQYTHARLLSLLEKARLISITPGTSLAPAVIYPVERLIYRFPEVVEESFRERSPHKVAQFLKELAGAFNTFYAQEKIIDRDDTYSPYKLAVAAATRVTIKNGLWVLGIKAPGQM